MISRLVRSCLPVLFVALASCSGGDDRPPTAKVTGTVTYGGEKVTAGAIAITTENGAQTSVGDIEEDGTYEIDGGAPLGVCVVEFQPVPPDHPSAEANKKFNSCVVPEDFRATIEAGKDNTVDIELIEGRRTDPENEA